MIVFFTGLAYNIGGCGRSKALSGSTEGPEKIRLFFLRDKGQNNAEEDLFFRCGISVDCISPFVF